MATIADMFTNASGRLDQAFQNPFMQLGLQMLQAGGFQEGDPSFGQRFGQAGMGFMQNRAQMQELELQKQLRQAQMIKAQTDAAEAQRQEAGRAAVRAEIERNPEAYKDNPLAAVILGKTGDPSQLSGLAAMMPKQGTSPFQYEKRNADGTITQMLRGQDGSYTEGATYTPTAQQNIYLGQDRLAQQGEQFTQRQGQQEDQFTRRQGQQQSQFETNQQFGIDKALADQEFRNRQLGQNQQQFEDTQQRQRDEALMNEQFRRDQLAATTAAQTADRQVRIAEENRKSLAAVQKRSIDQAKLQSEYRAATTHIDDAIKRTRALMEHKGLEGSFGVRGYIPAIRGTKAADFQTKLDEMKEVLSFKELQRLKETGVNLAPVTEAERDAAGKSVAGLSNQQSARQAKEQLQRVIDVLEQSKTEMGLKFDEFDSLYQTPQAPAAPAQAPAAGPAAPTNAPSYDQAVQEANQVLQQRPDLRDAVNQRLMQQYGKGL